MYTLVLGALLGVCGSLVFLSRHNNSTASHESGDGVPSAEQRRFSANYLLVYLLMNGADWLQGPYVYDLYQAYGFSRGEIGLLFIAGFGSSFLLGTFIGSLVDTIGRKKGAVMFGIIYSVGCLTKHFNSFSILLVGRVLSGVATSLLFSTFESWMVHEHHARGFPSSGLDSLFSRCTFWNSIVAIAAGVVAYLGKDLLGPVAPFDFSMIVLLIGTGVVLTSWKENFGNSNLDAIDSFKKALKHLRTDIRIPLLGLTQGFFEAAMYIFVFMWTPTLSQFDDAIPHGLVFSSFMVCVMIGSNVFSLLRKLLTVDVIMLILLSVTLICMLVPIVSTSLGPVFCSFLMFEVCVGLFWPAVSTLRSEIIPDECRSTIMNIFRLLLNGIVVIVLLKIGDMTIASVFMWCTLSVLLSGVCQLVVYMKNQSTTRSPDTFALGSM